MLSPHYRNTVLLSALTLALVACQPGTDSTAKPADASSPIAPATSVPAQAVPAVLDVHESSEIVTVDITYPAGSERYPGLLKAMTDYAQAQRDEMKTEVANAGDEKPLVPLNLTLAFDKVAETPSLVAIAGKGDFYSGGAHGMPLLPSFVWLPQQDSLMTADALMADAAGWQAVRDHVRVQLKAQSAKRTAENKALSASERVMILRDDAKSIDDGTEAKPENFVAFTPLLDDKQHIRALRFSFPPYQVGPYAYGIQSVEVPASVLKPHVAAGYRDLFAQ